MFFFSKRGTMSFNQFKTVLLLGALTGLLLLIGGWLGGRSGLTIAFVFAILMNFGSYFFSHKIVLFIYRAKPLAKEKAPKIHQIVEEIAKKAGMPKPGIYLIPSPHANAFCTGPSPKKAVVAVTEGILSLLSVEELRGVLAHEIGHAKNYDILISTIAATIASVISYVAMMARWAAIFGGMKGDDRGGHNMLELLVLAIIAPLAAMVIQLAISRSREYLADERGARLIGDGKPLANALEKLHANTSRLPLRFGSESTAHLFIVNPFKGGFASLFSTHPPHDERIKRLRAMKF